MIYVTKLNDKKIVINCEKIESIKSSPDTTIVMTNGKTFIVKDTVEYIIDRTIEFKNKSYFNN